MENEFMPKYLADFLKTLSPDEANETWSWLDNPGAIEEMQKILENEIP
jgi:hypothetical protein